MAQANCDNTCPRLTGKQAGQIFEVVKAARLPDLADRIEAANELDRLGINLRDAEFKFANVSAHEAVTSTEYRDAALQLTSDRVAVTNAYKAIRTGLHEMLVRVSDALRKLDAVPSSID